MKKTKIIATVGPVTESEENLKALYENGVNIIRFNFSHATHEHSKIISDRIKKLNKDGITNLSLLLDTKGPEIRTGIVETKINLIAGNKVKIVVDESIRGSEDIFCDYEYLLEDIKVGETIIIDSGLCNVEVLEIFDDYLIGNVLNSCVIGSKRHINLPGIRLRLPGITDKDKQDVLFAIENDFDFIAMSFVRNRENIEELKEFLSKNNAHHIKIISKVENEEALENLVDIVKYSDGVMVARGDLGIEVPIEKLPCIQKQIVNLCLKEGKFFVIATHLLETMIENPFPTRAEVSDIYNSVMQYTDCIMLSGETTTGKYPIESVKMMNKVICEAEKNILRNEVGFTNNDLGKNGFQKKSLIKNALNLSKDIEAKAIIIFTQYGFLAKMAAAFKTDSLIYAFTDNEKTHKFMNSLFGINPIKLDNFGSDYLKNLDNSIEYLKIKNILNHGDKIIIVGDLQRDGIEYPIIEVIEI